MKWTIGSLILILVGCLLGVVLWPVNSSKRTIPDGTTFVLSGAKIGRTNVYWHGTWLSKTIGHLAPAKGVTVAGLRLQPPTKVTFTGREESEILSAQILLRPGSPREAILLSPPFSRKFRLLISGDDDFVFVREFDGFKRQADGLFSQVWAWSFPRASKLLRFRVEERERREGRDWHELTTFLIKHPKPAQIESWKSEHFPRLKLAEGLEAEVGELTVQREPIHPDDIWEYLALLPLRLTHSGHVVTNWGIRDGTVRDASGNFDAFTFSKVITNDWMLYRMFRLLDPTKAWRFQVNFALDSDFPATNLFSFIVPWPLAGTIQTNLGGIAVRIGYVNMSMLSVELVEKPAGMRLTFVSASDDEGNNLDDWSGSWGQHSFWKSLKLRMPIQVHGTVAIHRNYQAEFTILPRYERTPNSPEKRPD